MIKKQIYTFISVILSFCVLILSILFSQSLAKGISFGIKVCLENLIPSLFFFMTLSAFLMNSGIGQKIFLPFNQVLSKLFHIPSSFISIFGFSLLGGFPVGAKLIADAVERREMNRETAERMLAFCVNCGPAFLISAVSIPIFQNFSVGLLVFFSQIFAAFLIGIISGWKHRKDKSFLMTIQSGYSQTPFTKIFVDTVLSTVRSMALICALILIFSGISQILNDTGLITALAKGIKVLPQTATDSLISGILEVTGGCNKLTLFSSIPLFILLTGFGGLCVQIQIKAIVHPYGIRINQFYFYRPLYILFSFFFYMVFQQFFPSILPVLQAKQTAAFRPYTVSPVLSVLLVGLSVLLLLSVRKSDIIKDNRKLRTISNQSVIKTNRRKK